MKTFIPNLTVILLLGFAIAGCKKDSTKDETTKNKVTVDGTEYEISKGFITNYGSYNSAYNFDLVLVSSGLTIHESSGLPDSASGNGNVVYFEMFSSSSDKLALGDYVYNDSGNAGSFDYADYMLNWNPTLQPNAFGVEIKTGTVKVINNGTEYELSFSGTNANNKTITGYYKGSLKYYIDNKKRGYNNAAGNSSAFLSKSLHFSSV